MLQLEGIRVRLEPLGADHVDALLAAATEDRSTYGFTWVPADRAAMADYVATGLDLAEAGEQVPFAVVSLPDGRVVGGTRFMDVERWPAITGGHEPAAVEIGHTWYAASAQRTGVNTEAKLLLLSHAFEVWPCLRVTLKTDARNQRSRAAILRIGATFEGIRRAHTVASDGTVRDSAYYSIVRDEWPEVRDTLTARVRAG